MQDSVTSDEPRGNGERGGNARRGAVAALAVPALAVVALVALSTLVLPRPATAPPERDSSGAVIPVPPPPMDKEYEDQFVERFQRAQKFLYVGKDKESEALLRELIAEQPDAAAVHHALGLVCVQLGRVREGLGSLEEASRLAPQDGAIRRDTGMRMLASGRAEPALVHLDAAHTLLGFDSETEVCRSRALQSLSRAAEAEAVLREAMNHDADSVDTRTGLAALVVLRDPKEALLLTDPIPENWADVVLVRGIAFARLGKAQAAQARCRRIVELTLDNAAAVPLLRDAAECLARLGDCEGASSAAERWVAIETSLSGVTPRAAFLLAVCRAAAGNANDALATLDDAPLPPTAPSPLRGMTGLVRAQILLSQGDRAAADAVLEQLARLEGAPFESAAALRILSRSEASTVADAAQRAPGGGAALANDVAWVEGLRALRDGDRAAVSARCAEAVALSTPPGEHPGLLAAALAGAPAEPPVEPPK